MTITPQQPSPQPSPKGRGGRCGVSPKGRGSLFGILLILLTSPALAQPTPPRKSEALQSLQSRIEAEKSTSAELQKKMATAQAQLDSTQQQMIALTRAVQDNEATLNTLDARIATLSAEASELNARIEKDYGSMADLVLALQRIRRIPTETLIVRPGAPLETAQSAMLLRSILPAINSRAESMAADLKRMQEIRTTLETDRAAARDTADKLSTQQAQIKTLLAEREALYRDTRTAHERQAEQIARMAAEAQSLQQLVARLEAEEREARRRAAATTTQPPRSTPKQQRNPAATASLPGGAWRPPVQGRLIAAFGERDEIGAVSEGIRISGRENGLVSAPAGGTIRFAGPFRHYGNMVIIEHDQGLHSLIAGLGRIDTQVGRKISAGEPVGALSPSGHGRTPALYYELRLNGKAVDPSAKFPDLSS